MSEWMNELRLDESINQSTGKLGYLSSSAANVCSLSVEEKLPCINKIVKSIWNYQTNNGTSVVFKKKAVHCTSKSKIHICVLNNIVPTVQFNK